MTRNILLLNFFVCLLLGLPQFVVAADKKAAAETAESTAAPTAFSCTQDISYRWEPRPPKPTPGQKPPVPVQKQEASEVTAREVFFIQAQGREFSEELAKQKLAADLTIQKQKAILRCREEHELTSSCIVHALRTSDEQFKSANFAARRVILDAINSDCENKAGTCLDVKVADTHCAAEASAAGATANSSSGAAEKDKKK